MSDDWKGEAAIRAKPTEAQRDLTTRSVAASVSHEKRRQMGVNMSRSGGMWAQSFKAWNLEAKRGEGK